MMTVVTVSMAMVQKMDMHFLLLQANLRPKNYILDGAAQHIAVPASPNNILCDRPPSNPLSN